jgi:hypothetical protein
MTATLSRYTLEWSATRGDTIPELGYIYTDEVTFYTVDGYRYDVSFHVGDGRRLGVLFVTVDQQDPQGYNQTMHYCLGQFYNNQGAIKFAKFALNHFIDTETWSVCPSFEAVDYIDGEPHTLGGDEIVSELYTW